MTETTPRRAQIAPRGSYRRAWPPDSRNKMKPHNDKAFSVRSGHIGLNVANRSCKIVHAVIMSLLKASLSHTTTMVTMDWLKKGHVDLKKSH